MREIDLVDSKAIPKRLEDLVKSFEIIYNHQVPADLEEISLDKLRPTELFLEKDKLALVFKKTIEENYNVPVIVTRYFDAYRILDGHHRSYIFKKLGKNNITAYVLKNLESREDMLVHYPSLEDMPIKDVGKIDDQYLLGWSYILTLMKYYEAIYDIAFRIRYESIALDSLVPTQSTIDKRRLDSVERVVVPITCINYAGKSYIIDGHVRVMAARRDGAKSIQSIILLPTEKIEYGIVKTAEKMGLKEVGDIKITE
jgi:hypothetical protein